MADKVKKEVTSAKVHRFLTGKVVSDKMQKTIVVKVTRRLKHSVLGKIVQKSKKYKVHDGEEIAHIGDLVEIKECRPLSKTKHMIISRVIKKA